jgi:hypothetical protein
MNRHLGRAGMAKSLISLARPKRSNPQIRSLNPEGVPDRGERRDGKPLSGHHCDAGNVADRPCACVVGVGGIGRALPGIDRGRSATFIPQKLPKSIIDSGI